MGFFKTSGAGESSYIGVIYQKIRDSVQIIKKNELLSDYEDHYTVSLNRDIPVMIYGDVVVEEQTLFKEFLDLDLIIQVYGRVVCEEKDIEEIKSYRNLRFEYIITKEEYNFIKFNKYKDKRDTWVKYSNYMEDLKEDICDKTYISEDWLSRKYFKM